MARYPAIASTGQAIVGLLSGAAGDTEFSQASFVLATSSDLQRPPGDRPTATVYLYRVEVDTTHRNLQPRRTGDGLLHKPPVPVILHYLVTAWSKDAVTQHRLLGWCIRTLQDAPLLAAGYLNQFGPEDQVFNPDETVELVWEVLSRQEMTDTWDLAQTNQQASVSYVARVIAIESDDLVHEYPPVQTIDARFVAGAG